MYCPKCGVEAVEGQRFCKACGTNLQLINNALSSGGKGPGPWNFDPEEIKRNITDFVDSWKKGIHHEHAEKWRADWDQYKKGRPYRQSEVARRRRAKDEVRRRNLPTPGQWMKYSRQHNFKEGLKSLFGGAGLSFLFYKLGEEVIKADLINQIPGIDPPQAHGLEVLARIFWLFMLIPVLKGLGQLIYGAFFAESLATLSERYTIPAGELSRSDQATEPSIRRSTAPQAPVSAPTNEFGRLAEAPPSVTENTTQFFEEAAARRQRESQ
jgi:hypothetical protein